MQNKIDAMSRQNQEAQLKAKAYLPIWASRPLLRKASRMITKVALLNLSAFVSRGQGTRDVRHEGNASGVDHQTQNGHEPTDRSSQPPEAGQEAAKEGECHEEQCNQVEHPAEPPHVEELGARRVSAVVTDQLGRRVGWVSRPGMSDRRVGRGLAAVQVAVTADVEVGPLGDGLGARDAGGVGAEEEGAVQGCCLLHAAEDDEPKHH
jgi:hypothetical protein